MSAPTAVPRGGRAGALVRSARPRQWPKNLLVLAAPVLSGTVGQPGVLASVALAFVAFCLASSGVYFVNDVRDINEDRNHPRKRLRPIPAGLIRIPAALAAAAVLSVASLTLTVAVDWRLTAVIGTYLATSLAYCLFLKDEPVIDIAIIASGFLLRAVAGGVAADIMLSEWFYLAASFGSLFMAAGKRYAEAVQSGPGEAATRRSLRRYTETYLRFVWSVSAAILIMTYGLWALDIQARYDTVWPAWSMAPFVLAVLRYAVDVDAGRAGEPEEIALSDRVLQVLGACWLALLLLAVYAR